MGGHHVNGPENRGGESEPSRPSASQPVSLATIFGQWGRLGVVGFGGPPAHIRLLRQLCVERRGWLTAAEFEDGLAACNVLPGPASTQLAIFCAWKVRGNAGALIGGLAFIAPGFFAIVALAQFFLADPPAWALAAGAGAAAAVPGVALVAARALAPDSWRRARDSSSPGLGVGAVWWSVFVVVGVVATVVSVGALVAALIGCGLVSVAVSLGRRSGSPLTKPPPSAMALSMVALGAASQPGSRTAGLRTQSLILTLTAAASASLGTLSALSWVSLKIGALSFGGGFVIVPLLQQDAVQRYGWVSNEEFLNAVALGQITPGPVVLTVAAVGYVAAGWAGALLSAAIVFAPSFIFILAGARYFDRLRTRPNIKAFLGGAGPAAIGAIAGSAWLLTQGLSDGWQYALALACSVLLLTGKVGVVRMLLIAALVGVVVSG